MSSTKLESLRLEEVSGVGAPANLLPGWMVTKARNGVIPALAKALESFSAEDFLAEIEKANPTQLRNRLGQFRPAITGIDTTPATPAAPEPPAAEKALGLFRPAQVYRRIW